MKATRSPSLMLVLLLALPLDQCGTKQTGVFRLVDALTEDDVVASPLISVEKTAHPADQEWRGRDMTELDAGYEQAVQFTIPENARTFIFPTEDTLLVWQEGQEPKDMEVTVDGNAVDFSFTLLEDRVNWRWLRLDSVIEPELYRNYKTYEQSVVLAREDFFTTVFLFPGGEVFFEITVKSVEPFSYLPHLYLAVDDSVRERFVIGQNNNYWASTDVGPGLHRIKIGFDDAISKAPSRMERRILLDKVRVRAQNDGILVTVRKDMADRFSDAVLTAKYLSAGDRRIYKGQDLSEPLKHNEYLEREIDLEQGISHLNAVCSSNDEDVYVQVWLNDEQVGYHKIAPFEERPYVFKILADEGRHRLKLQMKYWPSEGRSVSHVPELRTHRFFIKGPFAQADLPLLQMKKRFPVYDAGVGQDPYGIKQKLRIDEEYVNCLFSPARSEYVFRLKIPENSFLEFGCGLTQRVRGMPGEGAGFAVMIEDGPRKETLFSRLADPHSPEYRQNEHVRESIDLSAYGGKHVRLRLMTYPLPASMGHRDDFACWMNPVILSQKPRKEPNIILISLDALRSDRLGCYGYGRDTSPHLDALAKESALFSHCFVQAPFTLASHVSMLTALWPVNHGTYSTTRHRMDMSIPTLADLLRLQGYFTGAFTGGGAMSEYFGYSKGFDFYNERQGNVQGDTAAQTFRLSSDWIQRNKDKAFFLFVHTYQIHLPYEPPPPYDEMFTAEDEPYRKSSSIKEFLGRWEKLPDNIRQNISALYDGEVRYTDEALIGPLIELLMRLELYDRTMIIITSDHGEELYDHKGWGHSHTLYNELIKAPLVIKFPRGQFSGRRVESFVRSIDIMPTILEISGLGFRRDTFDGRSLIPLVKGEENKDRTFFSEIRYEEDVPDRVSSNLERMKLILNGSYTEKQLQTFLSPPPTMEREELFDLKADRDERSNIRPDERVIFGKIAAQIVRYQRQAKTKERRTDNQAVDERVREQLKALGYIK